MHLRISFARFLIKLGEFIQTLPVIVMRPDDLVEFSRQSYASPQVVKSWTMDELVCQGLSTEEQDLLGTYPIKNGKLLLLGVGGGREAIPLARMGYQVTGVDFVPAMVERALKNAASCGVNIEGLVQDITYLDVPDNSYEVVWLSSVTYSCLPTRKRRIGMVRRIARALKPGGYFFLQFHRDGYKPPSGKLQFARRLFAFCTLGNLAFEQGDMLWGNNEFIHAFATEEEVRSELEEGGLSVVRVQTEMNRVRCGMVAMKC